MWSWKDFGSLKSKNDWNQLMFKCCNFYFAMRMILHQVDSRNKQHSYLQMSICIFLPCKLFSWIHIVSWLNKHVIYLSLTTSQFKGALFTKIDLRCDLNINDVIVFDRFFICRSCQNLFSYSLCKAYGQHHVKNCVM